VAYGEGGYGLGDYGVGETDSGGSTFITLFDDMPAVSVDIDFDTPPTVTDRTWTSVTRDLRQLSAVRSGRSNQLARSQAGTMNCVLSNHTGNYDPDFELGAYYPNVKRTRWMRYQLLWEGTVYDRWAGLVEIYSRQWPGSGADEVCVVRGTDAFKVLNLFSLSGLTTTAGSSDDVAAQILTAVGLPYVVDEFSAETIPAQGPFTDSDKALDFLLKVEDTENGLLSALGDGSISFQGRHYRLLNSRDVLATFGDGDDEIPYVDAPFESADDNLWNDVAVTPAGGTPEVGTNATSQTQHFKRSLQKQSLSTSQTTAQSAAEYYAQLYGDPSSTIPAIVCPLRKNPDLWSDALTLVNSDRVRWIRRPAYGTISREFFVEQITDSFTLSDLRIGFQLSPAEATFGWLLGVDDYSELGDSTHVVF
jgi:hypothetical protein